MRRCLFHIKKPKHPHIGVLPKGHTSRGPRRECGFAAKNVSFQWGVSAVAGGDRSRKMTFIHKDVWDIKSSMIKQDSWEENKKYQSLHPFIKIFTHSNPKQTMPTKPCVFVRMILATSEWISNWKCLIRLSIFSYKKCRWFQVWLIWPPN